MYSIHMTTEKYAKPNYLAMVYALAALVYEKNLTAILSTTHQTWTSKALLGTASKITFNPF